MHVQTRAQGKVHQKVSGGSSEAYRDSGPSQRFIAGLLATTVAAAMLVGSPTPAAAATGTTIASTSSAGIQGNSSSDHAFVSAGGRFVAFSSYASNLVTGDTNGWDDVFVKDLETGSTVRASLSDTGAQSTYSSYVSGPPMDDGRLVVFSSPIAMVKGDRNGEGDIFVRDIIAGTTTLISVSAAGRGTNGGSGGAVMSADGLFVTYHSKATNIVAEDTSTDFDVYVYDMTSKTTSLVSKSSAGIKGNMQSTSPDISSDGRYVAFQSHAGNLVAGDTNNKDDMFVHDRQTGETTRVSVNSAEEQDDRGSDQSGLGDFLGNDGPAISDSGRYVAFWSFGTNYGGLSSGGADLQNHRDVFVRDRTLGITARVSVGLYGEEATAGSGSSLDISGNGRYVAFSSAAPNLTPTDSNTHDSFVRDLKNGTTELASVNSAGVQATGESKAASISRSGDIVALTSVATNLVSPDANGATRDVFVRNRTKDPIRSYVAMGDSYSAGETAGGAFSTLDASPECKRTDGGMPTHIKTDESPSTLLARSWASSEVSFELIACGGATTANIIAGGPSQHQEGSSQLDQGVVTSDTDLVTITIGGIDVEFADVLSTCFWNPCNDPLFQRDGMAFTDWLEAKINAVDVAIYNALGEVRAAAPNATFIVPSYPLLFPDTEAERACFKLSNFDDGEQGWLNDMGRLLNDAVRRSALASGAHYVDVVEQFRDHEVCGNSGEWINGPTADLDQKGAFHPNADGAQGYAVPVNAFLSDSSWASFSVGQAPASSRISDSQEVGVSASKIAASLGHLGRLNVSLADTQGSCSRSSVPLGSTLRIRGKGFSPSSRIELRLVSAKSGLVEKLTIRANRSGVVRRNFTPAGTHRGAHGLELDGRASDGTSLMLVRGFRVAAPCKVRGMGV